jgi:hypothetical protein
METLLIPVALFLAFVNRRRNDEPARHAHGSYSRRGANLITATLVLIASQLGLPVSSTHVSVGSIAGAGASAKMDVAEIVVIRRELHDG